jgi:hypothetical protein
MCSLRGFREVRLGETAKRENRSKRYLELPMYSAPEARRQTLAVIDFPDEVSYVRTDDAFS